MEYKAGALNTVADALSRRDMESDTLYAISSPSISLMDNIKDEVATSPTIQDIITKVSKGTESKDWAVRDGLLLYKNRVYLLPTSPLVPEIVSAIHNSTHEGIQEILVRVKADFYWQGMKATIHDFVKSCHVCQQHKWENMHPAGLLQPLHIPEQIWTDISMDFIDGLPKVAGKSVLLVVVDRLSKYAHFLPMSHPYTASSVAHLFFMHIVRLHGLPASIVSDRDPVFTSVFWRELFILCGTKLAFSSAYHPQTDGQTEVVNRTI